MLQFPRFSASSVPRLALRPSCRSAGALSPLGFFRTTSPKAAGGCGEFGTHLSEGISGARTPRRPDPGSYLEAALGTRAPQAGALPTGAHGPCAPAGSPAARGRSRRRAGAATRPCGWRRAAEEGRRAGGRAGGREPGSERASEASSARDSPALSAFILSPALLFPPSPWPRPPHLPPPLTLAGSAGREARAARPAKRGRAR